MGDGKSQWFMFTDELVHSLLLWSCNSQNMFLFQRKLLNPNINHMLIQRLIPSIFASCLSNIKVSITFFFFTMISISTENNDDRKHWCSFYHLIGITPGLLLLSILSSSSRLVPLLLPFYRWENRGRRSKITCSSSHGKWGIEIWTQASESGNKAPIPCVPRQRNALILQLISTLLMK